MRIAKVTLNTTDIAANRRFYVEFLGLKLLGEHKGAMLAFEGNLNFDSGHGNPPTTSAHIMLLWEDLEALKQRAADFGYPLIWENAWGAPALMFHDPDGRMVEVMKTSHWESLTADSASSAAQE